MDPSAPFETLFFLLISFLSTIYAANVELTWDFSTVDTLKDIPASRFPPKTTDEKTTSATFFCVGFAIFP